MLRSIAAFFSARVAPRHSAFPFVRCLIYISRRRCGTQLHLYSFLSLVHFTSGLSLISMACWKPYTKRTRTCEAACLLYILLCGEARVPCIMLIFFSSSNWQFSLAFVRGHFSLRQKRVKKRWQSFFSSEGCRLRRQRVSSVQVAIGASPPERDFSFHSHRPLLHFWYNYWWNQPHLFGPGTHALVIII